jgi:hypothetical protein
MDDLELEDAPKLDSINPESTSIDDHLTKADAAKLFVSEAAAQTRFVTNDRLLPAARAVPVWKDIPLAAGFSTETTRRAQYRVTEDNQHIEMRGCLLRNPTTNTFPADFESIVGTIVAADRPKEWVYTLVPGYPNNTSTKHLTVFVGIRSGGEVVVNPSIAAFKIYLDGAKVASFR